LSKKIEHKSKVDFERKPWIGKFKGLKIICIVSFALALWVGYQIIRAEGDWGKGILWGFIFGASIVLVYFGMNLFHSLMNKNKND
jgi:predicted cobalt transporter CbtA